MIFNIVFGIVAFLFVLNVGFDRYDERDVARAVSPKEFSKQWHIEHYFLLTLLVVMAIISKPNVPPIDKGGLISNFRNSIVSFLRNQFKANSCLTKFFPFGKAFLFKKRRFCGGLLWA